jgi:transposase
MLSGMRPRGSPEQLEKRRRQAVALSAHGYGPAEIARRLKTTPQSVCAWLRRHRQGGRSALAARPVPGRPSKLTARQRRALAACFLKGASAFGFATDFWTGPRVAELIRRRWGAAYHVDAIRRLMAGLVLPPSKARAAGR